MLLATLTAIATLATTQGTTCAAIDNGTNTAAWVGPNGHIAMTTYTDMDRIQYRIAPDWHDDAAWKALHAAERRLKVNADGTPTKIGHKVRMACRR